MYSGGLTYTYVCMYFGLQNRLFFLTYMYTYGLCMYGGVVIHLCTLPFCVLHSMLLWLEHVAYDNRPVERQLQYTASVTSTCSASTGASLLPLLETFRSTVAMDYMYVPTFFLTTCTCTCSLAILPGMRL